MSRSYAIDDLLNGPPPEVLDEVAAAWERAQEPLPDGLELWFASEPALGRAWGELRLEDGDWWPASAPPRRSPSPAATPRMAVAV